MWCRKERNEEKGSRLLPSHSVRMDSASRVLLNSVAISPFRFGYLQYDCEKKSSAQVV